MTAGEQDQSLYLVLEGQMEVLADRGTAAVTGGSRPSGRAV